MAYNTFTIQQIKKRFNIPTQTIFKSIFDTPVMVWQPSASLRKTLDYNIPLALAISTEKARSELIITPILIELKKITENQISFFSGLEFNVDVENGLNERCDYILSLDKEQSVITAPIITMVEAKNDNIAKGIGQCAAEMIAAKKFNDQNGLNIPIVYGVITTGSNWKILKLENGKIIIEAKEYFIENIEVIFGILLKMIGYEKVKVVAQV